MKTYIVEERAAANNLEACEECVFQNNTPGCDVKENGNFVCDVNTYFVIVKVEGGR